MTEDEKQKILEERWGNPDKCDGCGRIPTKKDNWTQEHATTGGSGFNFNWCPDCEKDDKKTWDIMCDTLLAWKKKCVAHWEKEGKWQI